jgi:hypothetical protein
MYETGDLPVVLGPDQSAFIVRAECQRQVVRVASGHQFRRAIRHRPSTGEQALLSEYRLDAIELANCSYIEGQRTDAQRVLAVANRVLALHLAQDDEHGTTGWLSDYGNCLVASNLFERPDLSVERE